MDCRLLENKSTLAGSLRQECDPASHDEFERFNKYVVSCDL